MSDCICTDCGGQIGLDAGPSDGWEMDDGRIICHSCCVADLHNFCEALSAVATKEITIN